MTQREKTQRAIKESAIPRYIHGSPFVVLIFERISKLELLALENADKLDSIISLAKDIRVVVRMNHSADGVKSLVDAIQEILNAEHR